jgi:hypothetical protein
MESNGLERRIAPCAEFPNDNPDLHHGAIWGCAELGHELACQRPRPRLRAELETAPPGPDLDTEPPAPLDEQPAGAEFDVSLRGGELLDADAEPIEIVDELCFDEALSEPSSGSAAPRPCDEPAAADPFALLVHALGDVARALGAGDQEIAYLDALFGQTRLEGLAPGERAAEALLAGGVIAMGARGFTRSSPFTAKVIAWQGILRGESEDFSLPDGGALGPLDEWAADVLARVLGAPARADAVRRDVRRRGVAAFGIVADAA